MPKSSLTRTLPAATPSRAQSGPAPQVAKTISAGKRRSDVHSSSKAIPANASKLDRIVHALGAAHGATMADLMEATGWQAHSLRGVIAGTLKKRGYVISSTRTEGEPRRYRIEAAG